jgi:DNA-binding NtrC family response regulator
MRRSGRVAVSNSNGSVVNGSAGSHGAHAIVGRSPAMVRLRERVAALARLTLPVLVRGEEGSGRSHVVAVLRELRGESGAEPWTLRSGDRRLLAPLDARRAVVLDEVGRFSELEQARWRDALVGGARPPLELFATSSDDLVELAKAGRFDPALAELLTRFTLNLPPLRERAGDVALLAEALALRACARIGREPLRPTRAALRLLAAHSWPGNVRELAAALERLVAFASGPRIERSHVEALFEESPKSVASTRTARTRRQREELARLIAETGGNLAEVARRLEMSRGGVIYRAQKFGLMQAPEGRAQRGAAERRSERRPCP